MMEFTKLVAARTYQPNITIIPRNEHVEYFFMIRRGEVEAVLLDRKNKETVISRLKPGEFFGEMELLRGGESIANLRAGSHSAAGVMTVKREDFQRVIDQSTI